MSDAADGVGRGGGDELVPVHRVGDGHESIAAALFGGFDDGPPQLFQSAAFGLSDAAGRLQRHAFGHAQFDQFFDQPALTVAFGQGGADDPSTRRLAVDALVRSHEHFHGRAAEAAHFALEFAARAVEQRDDIARFGAQHMEQVVGFRVHQLDGVAVDWLFDEKSRWHGSTGRDRAANSWGTNE